jgi:hypothetical protein
MQLARKQFWIPLVGIGLILVAVAITSVHSPWKLAAVGLGVFALAARAVFLYRKPRS